MKNIYSCLDIGSYTMKLIVGEIIEGKFQLLQVNEIKSKGIKKGVIVNREDAMTCLKELFRRTNDVLNININKVIVNIPSYYSDFVLSEGYTTINREDKMIKGEDILRTYQSSIYNKIPENRELVMIEPTMFLIDDEEKVIDPKNLVASKLASKVILVTIPKNNIYPIVEILESINVEVVDIGLSAIGDYYSLKKDEYKTGSTAVINIGHDITTVSIFNKGIMINSEIIPLGGRNINRDISYMYNISNKDSIFLKEKFGSASSRYANTSNFEIILNKNNQNIKVNQYEISEIISSRLKEILELSKKQINLLTKREISYIIVTGGTSELTSFKVAFQSIFGNKYDVSNMNYIGVRNNKFSTSVGLIIYYYQKLKFRDKYSSTLSLEQQEKLINNKNKFNIDSSSILGKVYGYFFDN